MPFKILPFKTFLLLSSDHGTFLSSAAVVKPSQCHCGPAKGRRIPLGRCPPQATASVATFSVLSILISILLTNAIQILPSITHCASRQVLLPWQKQPMGLCNGCRMGRSWLHPPLPPWPPPWIDSTRMEYVDDAVVSLRYCPRLTRLPMVCWHRHHQPMSCRDRLLLGLYFPKRLHQPAMLHHRSGDWFIRRIPSLYFYFSGKLPQCRQLYRVHSVPLFDSTLEVILNSKE